MSLLAPAGLFALLGLPVVLALHLFRRRPELRRVSALFLFAEGGATPAAGRRRQPLRRSASLLLELLAVVLLALWLAEPRFGISGDPPRLALVLDGSASMLALRADGSSTRSRASDAIAALLADLPADAETCVVVSGTRPEVLAGPSARPSEARTAIARWLPRSTSHDPLPALELATELAGEAAEIVFVTDGEWRDLPPRVHALGFGAASANAAIVGARRLAAVDGRVRVLCEVVSYGARGDARVEVVGSDGETRATRSLDLVDDAPHHLDFDVPAEDAVWVLRLHVEGDALGIDDSCALPPPARREVTIGVELPPQRRAALELDRALLAIEGVKETAPDSADLRITDQEVAPSGPRQSVLALQQHGSERDPWLGPFLVDHRDPLVQGMTLDGVLWVAGRGELRGARLVTAGDQVLLAVERGADNRIAVRLELDPEKSNLQRSPDWPILLQNVCEAVRAELPGPERAIVPVGTTVRWRGAGTHTLIEGPDGREVPTSGATARVFEARDPGVYRVVDEGAASGWLAAWFVDPLESELRTRGTFDHPASATSPGRERTTPTGTETERRVLALLLLAVVLGDFWLLCAGGPRRLVP